jgi:hypothetical protein
MIDKIIAMASDILNAIGSLGILSRIISGKGGYKLGSGTFEIKK